MAEIRICIIALLSVLSTATAVDASIIFVDRRATGAADGTSWSDAYVDLHDGLAAATVGDEVWVAKGKYRPAMRRNRAKSFVLPAGVSLLGGFRGDEATSLERAPSRHRTRINGNIGSKRDREDNTYRLLEWTADSAGAVIDGITFEQAFNTADATKGRGAGIYVSGEPVGVLHVRNCRFVDNWAVAGAGLFNEGGNVFVEMCIFTDLAQSALCNKSGEINIRSCRFVGNGGGNGEGGAVRQLGGTVTIDLCYFEENVARSRGGAIYTRSELTVRNSVFMDNWARETGGAIYQFAGDLTLVQSTFIGNIAAEFWPGGIAGLAGPAIRNCVFYGNISGRREGEDAQMDFEEEAPQIDDCLVEGWTGQYGGEGNFDADPMFINEAGRNLRLAAGSPCIDRGDRDGQSTGYDLDGNPRTLGRRVDLGAYENTCERIRRIRLHKKRDQVEVRIKARLPFGSRVFVSLGEGESLETITVGGQELRRSSATLVWPCSDEEITVCIDGCPDSCETLACP